MIASAPELASKSASSLMAMQASARTYPSAEASKVLQRPSWVSIPAVKAAAVVLSASMVFTAPAKAVPPCFSRFWTAMWAATSAEEQAVSILACNIKLLADINIAVMRLPSFTRQLTSCGPTCTLIAALGYDFGLPSTR